jgi:hypothetical protein
MSGVQIEKAIAETRLLSVRQLHRELSIAILADVFRFAGARVNDLDLVQIESSLSDSQANLLGFLAQAHLDSSVMSALSTYGQEVAAGLAEKAEGKRPVLGKKTLGRWLDRLAVVRFEEVIEPTVRQEELLRKWLAVLGIPVRGETPAQSAKRLSHIDAASAAVMLAWSSDTSGTPNLATTSSKQRRRQGLVGVAAAIGLAAFIGSRG